MTIRTMRSPKEIARMQKKVSKMTAQGLSTSNIAARLSVARSVVTYYRVRGRQLATGDGKTPCKNCGKRTHSKRARGLCWPCFNNPEIKAQFPASHKYGAKRNPHGVSFAWTNNPDLFPCGGCIVEPVTQPGALCTDCQKITNTKEPA